MVKRFSSRAGIAAIVALVVVLGTASLGLFLQHESTRDNVQWQEKLSLVADARARELSSWMQLQFKELTTLADNASVQIYVGQLNAPGDEAEAAGDYLLTLLNTNARRLDFVNTEEVQGGFAITDMKGKTLVATQGMPKVEGELADYVAQAPRAEPALIDMNGTPRLGFIIPIYSVQGERNAASQIGSLIGLRPLDTKFFHMLAPSNEIGQTHEILLLRKEGETLRYLSPLLDGTLPLARTEPLSETSAAGQALLQPGTFGTNTDYRGNEVLLASRSIDGTPWVIATKIDRTEAFAASARSRIAITVAFLSLLAALAATVAAIWRHISAREREQRMRTLDQLVDMIVSFIDRRDPHAAERSTRVCRLAGSVARALRCDKLTTDTTETAARLMHIGHVDVPAEWLTRNAPLSDKERAAIKSSYTTAADLLSNIAFEGPVVETLRQASEHVDGSGPRNLKGDRILLSARIVAACDALVGMLTARAYRQPMSMVQALQVLQNAAGQKFDADVVTALVNYVENQGGRDLLKKAA